MVIVVNFGGQYAHLIARRVRELGVRSELVPPSINSKEIKKIAPDAIIFSGSPFSVYEDNSPKIDLDIYKLNIPILGICYGQQLFAYQLGGKVVPKVKKQFGKEIIKTSQSPLFNGIKKEETVWFSHGDQVETIPRGFKIIATTKNAKAAAIENKMLNFFGVQFHPEVTHTPSGMKILSNFLFKISKAKSDWNLENITNQIIANLRTKIGNQKVIIAISGGVDSLVAATLLSKAIGNHLYPVFINTGLLRGGEVDEVKNIVKKSKLPNLKTVDAKKVFLRQLRGILDPEEKRKIIANNYFKVFEDEAKRIGKVEFLAQGTIYPDRVESASTSQHADKIKSHHNLTLPDGLKLQIVEPLADFYKDEVRKIGNILQLPKEFLNRHPFPGPGLAIRILGEVTQERLDIVKVADAIFTDELKKAKLYEKISQALAALIPVKTVGVMGDARTYSYIITLRAVDTLDYMTADWSKIHEDVLEKISSRIVNEVRGVNRVLYDITQKPPATIEYE